MKRNWWKILGAALVLYSLILGLITPLSPGIVAVNPDKINYGVSSIFINGYNTHFLEAEGSNQVWITNGQSIFCPYEYQIISDSELRVSFSVTDEIEESFFHLFVSNEIDGTLKLDNAFLQNGLEVTLNPPVINTCKEELAIIEVDRFSFSNQSILYETIRNLFFHVPSWFAMMFIMGVSLFYSIKFLSSNKIQDDIRATQAANVGLLFGAIGLATGSIWAKYTWGAWWVSDPRLNGAALSMLVYLAYFILKGSINDEDKSARIGAVYNIFAFAMLMLFIMILPRLTDSLHPGVGGNPAFSKYDLDENMRLAFYPGVVGWILVSLWLTNLRFRMQTIKRKLYYNEDI